MSADNGMPEPHAFGRWRFNAHTGDLFDGATTTRFEPQVAKLLDYFLRHQNTLISRDEGKTWAKSNLIGPTPRQRACSASASATSISCAMGCSE